MILKYSPPYEELIFAIRYLSLPLKYIEQDTDITLDTEEGTSSGMLQILAELQKLCLCEPHDITLLNADTIKDINKIHNTPAKSYLKTLFSNQDPCKDENKPSHIHLMAYVNKKSFSIADILLFAKTYKALLEGMKLDAKESEWFYEFQESLDKKMCFKKMHEFDFKFLKIRIGKIIKIENHPEADRLFIEEVSFEDEKRTIVSGLRSYYKEEDLLGKYCLFLVNLKKSKLKGIESQGMILCVKNGENIKVLEAPCDKEGLEVRLNEEGIDVVKHWCSRILDGKSEIFKSIMARLKTENYVMKFDGISLSVNNQEIRSEFKDGDVS